MWYISPNIPPRIALPNFDAMIHLLLELQAADPLVTVRLGTDVVRFGGGGFVIVKPGEVVFGKPVGIGEEL